MRENAIGVVDVAGSKRCVVQLKLVDRRLHEICAADPGEAPLGHKPSCDDKQAPGEEKICRHGEGSGQVKATRSRLRRPCPICGMPSSQRYRPFCSRRCADIDLHRWFTGRYRITTGDQVQQKDGEE